MRIEDPYGNEVTDMASWANIFDTPRERVHWKEHRSAHTLADFVVSRAGIDTLRPRIEAVLGQDVTFERGVIEHEVGFDEIGKGP